MGTMTEDGRENWYHNEEEIIELRSKGLTYARIHEHIVQKGYTGTVASLRVFMQKKRTHQKNISPNETVPVEYIPRKTMCHLIYHELESVKGITAEQYEAVIQKYPVLAPLYKLLTEFYRIVFSRKSEELDSWMEAEGSVNKIKLTKRIMYGRNSFALLKAKLLINEYFHQIN